MCSNEIKSHHSTFLARPVLLLGVIYYSLKLVNSGPKLPWSDQCFCFQSTGDQFWGCLLPCCIPWGREVSCGLWSCWGIGVLKGPVRPLCTSPLDNWGCWRGLRELVQVHKSASFVTWEYISSIDGRKVWNWTGMRFLDYPLTSITWSISFPLWDRYTVTLYNKDSFWNRLDSTAKWKNE